MAIGNLVALASHGLFSSGGGGVCDYPSEDDVRDGVTFDFGSQIGNLELPAEDDVLLGVGYGSNGTEFVGTLAGPPTPVPPTGGSMPFAAIATALRNRLAVVLGITTDYIRPVANDRYKVTETEPLFCYLQFFTPGQPKDPALNFTDAGAGNLARPVGRRVRVYVYTRSGEDVVGGDEIALFGANPIQTYATPPTMPGQFVAEEWVFSALNDFQPLTSDDEPLTLGPLHPLDASEEPQRKAEDEEGLLRSCLDFEVVYLLCSDPTEPASS